MSRQKHLLEDKKALQDSIKRALTANDDEEVKRLTKHLEWLNNYLKENENEA